MKIALISDIHSAAEHFRDALSAARAEGFDRLVILGDLLTYGPDPLEVIEIAADAIARDAAVLLTGNHDILYLPGRGGEDYAAKLPDWIRESVDWTRNRIGGEQLWRFPWQEDWQEDGVYISHANPFGFGDWRYLRDPDSAAIAIAALREKSLDCGIFGHVHRFREYRADGGIVVTVGSIGQPRDKAQPFSQWAVACSGSPFSVEPRRVQRDWASTIEKIRNTSMSDATKERLCQFYR